MIALVSIYFWTSEPHKICACSFLWFPPLPSKDYRVVQYLKFQKKVSRANLQNRTKEFKWVHYNWPFWGALIVWHSGSELKKIVAGIPASLKFCCPSPEILDKLVLVKFTNGINLRIDLSIMTIKTGFTDYKDIHDKEEMVTIRRLLAAARIILVVFELLQLFMMLSKL